MWIATERDVFQMELCAEYRPRVRELTNHTFPPPILSDCCNLILNTEDRFVKSYANGKLKTYLSDKKIKDSNGRKFLVLLISISDQRQPDGVLTVPESNTRREIIKNAGEGSDHSCHVVIEVSPVMQGGRYYRAAIEQVPLFTSTHVNRVVRNIFRKATMDSNLKASDPRGIRVNGEFAKVSVALMTEFKAVPSDELLRDLKNGVLSGIELSQEVPGKVGFDQSNYTYDRTRKILVAPNPVVQARIMDVISSVCAAAKARNFDTAKVVWKNGTKTSSAKFDVDTASVAENRYIRRKSIKLRNPLPASCRKIDDYLAEEMIKWIS